MLAGSGAPVASAVARGLHRQDLGGDREKRAARFDRIVILARGGRLVEAVDALRDLHRRRPREAGAGEAAALLEILRAAASSEDAGARWCARGARGPADSSDDLPDIQRAARSATWWWRLEAARVVRERLAAATGGFQAVLEDLAGDPDWRVRSMASGRVDAPEPTAERTGERAVEEAQALEVFFGPSEAPKERILSCLRAEAWLARWLGARALAARGEPSAIPDLTPLLDDKDWWVRRAAVEAIGKLAPRGNPAAARGALERALADRDLGVRVWAVRGLWRLEAGGVTDKRSSDGRHG